MIEHPQTGAFDAATGRPIIPLPYFYLLRIACPVCGEKFWRRAKYELHYRHWMMRASGGA